MLRMLRRISSCKFFIFRFVYLVINLFSNIAYILHLMHLKNIDNFDILYTQIFTGRFWNVPECF